MAKIDINGIHTVKKKLANGKIVKYYYDRHTGIAIKGVFGSHEFIENLRELRKNNFSREYGTLAQIIRDYEKSQTFKNTAKSTQQGYKYRFKTIEDLYGTLPIAALTEFEFRRHVQKWGAKKAEESPKGADTVIGILSVILNFAVENGVIEKNVIKGIKKFYKSNRSEKIWTKENIEAFLSHAPNELKCIMAIALCTGQRRGDILALTWGQYDGKAITLKQEKTGKRVFIPCIKPLRDVIDAIPRRSTVMLTQANKRPWKPTTFSAAWIKTCRLAGVEGLHFHDLRGTAVTWLAEAGCEIPEIAAITGHSMSNCSHILETYMARTHKMAGNAMLKLEGNFNFKL